MKGMIKKPFLILALCVVASVAVYAMSVQAVLNGKIVDKTTNKPVTVSYLIKNVNSDAEVQGKAMNGEYQAVLEAGNTYEITLWSFDTWRLSETFTMRDSKEYYEEQKNFEVMALAKGKQLFAWDLFDGAALTAKGKKTFEEFLNDMRTNRAVYVEVMAKSAAQKDALEALVNGNRRVKKRITVSTGATGSNQVVVKVVKVKEPF